MTTLIQLPTELISNILSFVELEDLAKVNLACKCLYHVVKDNTALHRALYLNHLVSSGFQSSETVDTIKNTRHMRIAPNMLISCSGLHGRE